ncbi:MAG: alpha/beta hydrolase, partial [Pirellulaceae bacterium]
RIQLAPKETVATPAASTFDLKQHLGGASHHPSRHCSLFTPMHYERKYAYPLLIWLHGPGDDERQLQRVMPLISMRNYAAVGPRGTQQMATRGFTWGEADQSLISAEQRVFDCVEAAANKYHIASRRIFLAGFEAGGTTAFQIGLRNPGQFAGVLSLGGPFPLNRMPLTRLDEARSLPLFIAQGRDSERYPIDRTCEELRLFHVAGLSVTLRQYPCGDELNTQMLHDMDSWMMEIVTGVTSEATASDISNDWN